MMRRAKPVRDEIPDSARPAPQAGAIAPTSGQALSCRSGQKDKT